MIFTRPGSEDREIVAVQRVGVPSYGYYTRTETGQGELWYLTMDVRDWNYHAEIARWEAEGYSSIAKPCPECSHPVSEHTSMLNAACTHGSCYCRWYKNTDEADLPWGKPVRVTIPEKFWSLEWRRGRRAQVWLGRLCTHCGGGVCLQPSLRDDPEAPCIPLDLRSVTIEALNGRLEDYL